MGQGKSDYILGVIWITVWIIWIQAFFKRSYSQIILQWILAIFLGYVRNGERKKWLDFGRDSDHHLDLVDPEILKKDNFKKLWTDFDEIFRKCPKWDKELLMVGLESPGIELPWQRSALSECSC